jgi:hypothetical protein
VVVFTVVAAFIISLVLVSCADTIKDTKAKDKEAGVSNDEADFESESMEKQDHVQQQGNMVDQEVGSGQELDSSHQVSMSAPNPVNNYRHVPVTFSVRATIITPHDFDHHHPVFHALAPTLTPVRPLDTNKHYVKPVILNHPTHYHKYISHLAHHAPHDDAENYVLPHHADVHPIDHVAHHLDHAHPEHVDHPVFDNDDHPLHFPHLPPEGFEPEYFDEDDDGHRFHHPHDVEGARKRLSPDEYALGDAEQDVQDMINRRPRRADDDDDLYASLHLDKKKKKKHKKDKKKKNQSDIERADRAMEAAKAKAKEASLSPSPQIPAPQSQSIDAAFNAVKTQVATRLKRQATELMDTRLQRVLKRVEERSAMKLKKATKRTKKYIRQEMKKELRKDIKEKIIPYLADAEERLFQQVA